MALQAVSGTALAQTPGAAPTAATSLGGAPASVSANGASPSSSSAVGASPNAPTPTAPAPAPVPASSTKPVDALDGPLGTRTSVAVEALPANGGWLAFCQPTADSDGDGKLEVRSGPRGEPRGDVPNVFLATGGEARPIDELLAFDASGRFLIVRSEGKPWLIDDENGSLTDLSPYQPDLRADEEYSLAHRALSFDENGQKLLLLRKKGAKQYEADLFDLSAGFDAKQKQTWVLAPGEVWRVRLSPDGMLALFESVPEGLREGDGWPVPPRKTKLQRCHGLVVSASGWNGRGGQVTRTVVSTRSGLPALAPGFVSTFGNNWVRREKSGRLMLVSGSTQKQLVSARCGGRIVHSDPSRELMIVACEHFTVGRPEKTELLAQKPARLPPRPPSKTRFDLYLVGPGYVKDLEADVGLTGLDLDPADSPRLVPLRPGARSVLVDLDRRELVELGADDRVVSTYGAHALVRRGAKLSLYDANTGKSTPLADRVNPFPTILVSGRYAYVDPYLVDLDTGRVVLEAAGTPLALSENGRLVFAEVPPSAERWAAGPLRFVGPKTQPDEAANTEKTAGPR